MAKNILRRYTNLASLISILMKKELTLLDPSKWEDRNDNHYLLKYAERKGYKSLYALCFTTGDESAQHWKTFSNGADGVCIQIDSDLFFTSLEKIKETEHRKVEYKSIPEIEVDSFSTDDLPFLKRHQFRGEEEYRLIFRKTEPSPIKTQSIPFDIDCIEAISLSNSLVEQLKDPVVALLRSIDGCVNLKISRSTLNENTRWKNACERAT